MNKPCEVFKKVLSKGHIRIKLLGDSITHGLGGVGFEQDGEPIVEGFARNPNGYCWAKLFKDYMKEKYGAEVINNACTGTDIQFIIKHFDALVDESDDIIICAIGTNNRNYYNGQWDHTPTREEYGRAFYNHILDLYDMTEKAGKEIIFIANTPVLPRREEDGPTWIMLLHMDDINAIYKKASEKAGFPLISLYELFNEYVDTTDVDPETLYWDGGHPSDRGYDVIFKLLTKELKL